MATVSPSWLDSWDTTFPDLDAIYDSTIRNQFPPGLYDDESSDEYKDIGAIARVFSWTVQSSTWIKRKIWPQADSYGQFLAYWEKCFGIVAASDSFERIHNILRSARYSLGTATKATVQAIFAPLFGDPDDPSCVSFASPSAAEIIAAGLTSEDEWAQATTALHIYHTTETEEPNRTAALETIEQTKDAHETWTIGQYQTALYDTEGGYDTACYGP